MAVKKEQLLEEAQALGLDVGEGNTVAEIKQSIGKTQADAKHKKPAKTKGFDGNLGSNNIEEKTPEDILKENKQEKKTAKKAGPKASRAKKEAQEDEKPKTEDKPKKSIKPSRPRIERRGKKYREAHKLLEKGKEYSLEEAIELLPKTSYVQFTPSVELHANLGVDPKQADQMVRGTVVLPHGTGKSQRVAVVAPAEEQKKAKDAGANVVGEDDLLEKIKKGQFDFDILVATPAVMPKLGQHAKVLGPKGLMPNPKSGTVTSDVARTVKELKGGRVEFRVDSAGIIHQVVGKLDLKPAELNANIKALLNAIQQAKPDGVKGIYIKKLSLTTSMGPSIKLSSSEALS